MACIEVHSELCLRHVCMCTGTINLISETESDTIMEGGGLRCRGTDGRKGEVAFQILRFEELRVRVHE